MGPAAPKRSSPCLILAPHNRDTDLVPLSRQLTSPAFPLHRAVVTGRSQLQHLRVYSRPIRRPSIGGRYHPTHHVPPSWFLTTSASFSAQAPRACCIPLPVLRFAAFGRRRDVAALLVRTPGRLLGLLRRFPATGSRTLRRSHVDSRTRSRRGRRICTLRTPVSPQAVAPLAFRFFHETLIYLLRGPLQCGLGGPAPADAEAP